MQNRDFKGVWIPKEIWLNTELSITDKVLLAEIDSLDNENHCTASNEYFSEFFKVSVPTISRSIKKLKDLGFIETEMVNSNTGSYRIIKVIQGSNQNDETGLINLTTNYNSNNNKNTLSKDNVLAQQEFNFGVSDEKSKKKTNNEEYLDACLLINNFTDDKELKKLLGELLDNRFEFSGKQRHHFYASTFKHYLDELSKVNDKIGAVKLSLQYNSTLKVMEPRLQYVSITSTPDTNTAPQVKYSSDEDRISKMARNDDGTPMTF